MVSVFFVASLMPFLFLSLLPSSACLHTTHTTHTTHNTTHTHMQAKLLFLTRSMIEALNENEPPKQRRRGRSNSVPSSPSTVTSSSLQQGAKGAKLGGNSSIKP